MAVSVSDVADFLGERTVVAQLLPGAEIDSQAALVPGRAGAVSFARGGGSGVEEAVRGSASSLLLVTPELLELVPDGISAIAVSNPRLEFARVVQHFFVPRPAPEVHPRAVIHPSARVGSAAWIDAGAVIGAGCRIGDRASIGANAVIGAGCVLGDDVSVGPGTVIGHTGFGYEREADGTPVLLPHSGGVRIGDRVEIGANTAIDRGTIDDTVIEDDAKIDNLVHIAHNCRVRRGAFVIASSILCGGVDVGVESWIAPNATIREQCSVGEGALVGLSATVVRDVTPRTVVSGSPARELPPRT